MGRVAVDLIALADALRVRGLHPQLERKIRRFHGRAVVRADLDVAQQSVLQLSAMLNHAGGAQALTPTEAFIGQALLTQAVVAYCRALVSKGEGRSASGAEAQFGPADWEAHTRIAGVRNRRIAHYGISTDASEAEWSDDRSILAIDDLRVRINFAISRAAWTNRILHDLEQVCATATPILQQLTTEAMDGVFDEVARIMPNDELRELMLACPFHPEAFFDDPSQAALTFDDGPLSGVRVSFFRA